MEKKSLGKNAVLNTIKSAMAVIFPLITFPYVSNILGVEALGRYNFSYSVNSYFLMLAALGVSSYAVREGAAYRDDRDRFSAFASEIYTVNIISSAVAYILLFFCVIFIPQITNYRDCVLVFSLEIIFTTMGVEWLYIIYEEYAYITVRRISFQLISMILLFALVKDSNDTIIYTGITVFANVGANLLNIINIKKYCSLRVVLSKGLLRHLKSILTIFASTLAIKIYTSSDTIMLGLFSGDAAVGLYSVAVKVYNVVKPLLSAVLVVAVPRLSLYIGTGNKEAYISTLHKIYVALLMIVLPAVVGMSMVSKDIILFLSNDQFLQANPSLKMLSIAIVFSIFSSFYNQCVLIPLKYEKKFLAATVYSAIANVIMNVILIPIYDQNGAAAATVIAEAISMYMCYDAAKKHIRRPGTRHVICSTGVGCAGIIVTCLGVRMLKLNSIWSLLSSVIVSVFLYIAILVVLKNEVILQGIDILKEKRRRKK